MRTNKCNVTILMLQQFPRPLVTGVTFTLKKSEEIDRCLEMAGGIDLALADLLEKYRATNPNIKFKDILDLAQQASSEFQLVSVRIPKGLANKPLHGYFSTSPKE